MIDATKSRVEIGGTFADILMELAIIVHKIRKQIASFGGTYYAAECIKEALRCSKMQTEAEIVSYYEDKAARIGRSSSGRLGGVRDADRRPDQGHPFVTDRQSCHHPELHNQV